MVTLSSIRFMEQIQIVEYYSNFYLFLFLEHAAHALIAAGGRPCARVSILIDRATQILGSKPR